MTTTGTTRIDRTNRHSRLGVALGVLLLVVSACTNSDSRSSRSDDAGVRRYEATISRTSGGVAHISASDLGSLSFGQGFASGEDHTCDLAQEILKVNSVRSRWFGPGDNDANVTSDFGWLALGIRERSERDYPEQSDELHEMIAGFTAGWNQHLEQTGVDAIDGWCRGEPWVEPISELDLYTYSRSVMVLASGAQLLDYIADAQPPATDSSDSSEADQASGFSADPDLSPASDPIIASNGWAIGSERSDSGGGMLLANPHFPWEGPLRFWEVGLEIPGELNVYGAQLTGLPGVGIGFNDAVAWTHTVSAGNRFTAYTLDLVDGDPTSYRYDGEVRKMESTDRTIYVLHPDGSMTPMTRTLWRSHYGPIVDFPGVGWTASRTMTYRDANIDNTAFFDQYIGMDRARSLDDFIAVHEKSTGVPLFNTIAVGREGQAWYADTSATPNLSAQAIDEYEASIDNDFLVAMAARRGVVLLDGSTSSNEWIDEPGARSPGLVPFSKMPRTTRSDYVFNANDSFWLSNADEVLEGDYSPLHGTQRTPVSPRTHQNAATLRDTSATGPSGADGKFSLDELTTAALLDEGWTAHQLRSEVVERCTGVDTVVVPESTDGGLPAASVDITQACSVLGSWDGHYGLDSVGAALWRELFAQFKVGDLSDAGSVFSIPFDPSNPVDTPSQLIPATPGEPDPILVTLARAVQVFAKTDFPLDVKLGDVQFADRNGTRVGVHGGDGVDGVTNVVTWAGPTFPTGETLSTRGDRIAPWSSLTANGYPVDAGTSFLMTVQYNNGVPAARSILTYGNTGDRTAPLFTSATEQFAAKHWKPVLFTADQIAGDPNLTTVTVHN